MARASFVACSMSFEAPVVISPNTTSSAARPPVNVAILFSISCLVIRYLSPVSTCIVYPSAPEVRGMIVIFCTGAEWVCIAATRAWPIS